MDYDYTSCSSAGDKYSVSGCKDIHHESCSKQDMCNHHLQPPLAAPMRRSRATPVWNALLGRQALATITPLVRIESNALSLSARHRAKCIEFVGSA